MPLFLPYIPFVRLLGGIVVILVLFAAGCGNKGPLYLPEQMQQSQDEDQQSENNRKGIVESPTP